MSSQRAFLGQVPLLGRPTSGLSISEGEEIPANGGIVTKRDGILWFLLDADTRAKLEDALFWEQIPEAVEIRGFLCNPTPGTMAALGDVTDPETGFTCFLNLPEGWSHAWMWGDVSDDGDRFPPPGIPPYWGEWGVVGEGRCMDTGTVGPFDTSDEAFTAAAKAASDHGATKMPIDGFAQVMDSQGTPVGPII